MDMDSNPLFMNQLAEQAEVFALDRVSTEEDVVNTAIFVLKDRATIEKN